MSCAGGHSCPPWGRSQRRGDPRLTSDIATTPASPVTSNSGGDSPTRHRSAARSMRARRDRARRAAQPTRERRQLPSTIPCPAPKLLAVTRGRARPAMRLQKLPASGLRAPLTCDVGAASPLGGYCVRPPRSVAAGPHPLGAVGVDTLASPGRNQASAEAAPARSLPSIPIASWALRRRSLLADGRSLPDDRGLARGARWGVCRGACFRFESVRANAPGVCPVRWWAGASPS